MEIFRQSQGESSGEGIVPVKNEDPGASSAQGEGGGPGSDGTGLLELATPIPDSGLVTDQPSPEDRQLLPSFDIDGGVMEELGGILANVRVAQDSRGEMLEILPSEVGALHPTRVSPMTGEGSGSNVDGMQEGVEPLEGDIPPEESDNPEFIDGSLDSQGAQEGLGAIGAAGVTAATATEVPSDGESNPDPSGAETSRPIHPGHLGFMGPDHQFSSTPNLPTPFGSERRASPGILRGRPHPSDPNELRNATNPIHRYSQGQSLNAPTGQGSRFSPGQASRSKGKSVSWDQSTYDPSSSTSRGLRGSPDSHMPLNTLYSSPGSQASSSGTGAQRYSSLIPRTPSPRPQAPESSSGLFREQTSQLHPSTSGEVRPYRYSSLIPRTPSPRPHNDDPPPYPGCGGHCGALTPAGRCVLHENVIPQGSPAAQATAKKSKGWRHAAAKKLGRFFKRPPGGEGPAA